MVAALFLVGMEAVGGTFVNPSAWPRAGPVTVGRAVVSCLMPCVHSPVHPRGDP